MGPRLRGTGPLRSSLPPLDLPLLQPGPGAQDRSPGGGRGASERVPGEAPGLGGEHFRGEALNSRCLVGFQETQAH